MKRIVLSILLIFLLVSCSKDEEVKEVASISKMQESKGTPVRVTTVEMGDLEKWSDYSSVLEGSEQTTVFGMLNDELEKIHVKIGDKVQKDQVIAQFAQDTPEAKYKQAKINLDTVEKTYNRMKKVFESGGISRQEFDNIEAQYKVAQENLNSTKKMVYVKAPISGIVVDVIAKEGRRISPADPVCKIARFNNLKTTVYVDEKDINYYTKGQKVFVKWDALKGEKFEGTIKKISLSADPEMRGFAVEIDIPNPDNKLRPGIFVDIEIRIEDIKNIISVPRQTILKEGEKEYVYIIESGKAVKKYIETGIENGTKIQVTAGLNIGDALVYEGHNILSNGNKVKVVN